MRRIMMGWVMAVALLAPPSARAAGLSEEAAGAIVTARHDVQLAVNEGSASDLLGVRAALLALSEDELASAPAQYTLAYLDWRLVPLWMRAHADK